MPSAFDFIQVVADISQLAVFGEPATFHDPNGIVPDVVITIIFVEKDVPEPPNNMGASKGWYSTAWAAYDSLPVPDPSGYQFVVGADTYWIRESTVETGNVGVAMRLQKMR